MKIKRLSDGKILTSKEIWKEELYLNLSNNDICEKYYSDMLDVSEQYEIIDDKQELIDKIEDRVKRQRKVMDRCTNNGWLKAKNQEHIYALE